MLIIDTHCHAGRSWFEPIEILELEMDRNGVHKAVLIQHGGTYDNTYLLQEAAWRPGRFKVAVLVDPESSDPLGDLTRLAEQGVAGVRIAPAGRFAKAGPYDMWRRAGELGLVVTSLGRVSEFASADFARVLDACPDTHVILEHLAGAGIDEPPYADFAAALRHGERGNTSIKVPGLGEICSRPPRLLPELEFDHVPPLFEMARDAFGVQRMMWGSDFPPSAAREGYANTLRGVMDHPAFAGGDDIEWVMGRTAERTWGF